MASLFRSARRARQNRDCPRIEYPNAAGDDSQYNPGAFEARGGSRLVLLTVMAFVLPVVVSVVVVQFIESRIGSAMAAIAGLAAAGLTAATSARIVKRFACRSTAAGADR
ncbi:MAG: hypothetical protein H7Z17_01205 [Fuerstia sp.]|nr:hypothetical protein [Fuerstiella sp.]